MGKDIFDYPVLKKSKHSELVVSFEAMNTATVVVPNERYNKGFMSNGWDSHLSLDVWEDGLYVIPASPCEPTAEELDDMEQDFTVTEVTEQKYNDHYKNQGIDTFARSEANMSEAEILASIKFNIDKYNWRDKGQSKEDLSKIIVYAKWGLEVLANDSIV